jgi:hypothetical protein
MALPRIPAAAVAAGAALDRADSFDELDEAWARENCDRFRGASGIYIRSIYHGVRKRLLGHAQALQWARAS